MSHRNSATSQHLLFCLSLSHSLLPITLLPSYLNIATPAVNLLFVFDSELDHKCLILV